MVTVRRKWTVRLNALIQSKYSSTRWSSIVLIKTTCEQSPDLLFTQIQSWTNQLLGLISKPESPTVHEIAIETLSYIFTYTSNKPELQREITIPNLNRFCNTLLNLGQSKELLPTIFLVLKNTIIHFPSQSRHIADSTFKLILTCIDGTFAFDSNLVSAAGHCLSALQRVPGKTNSSDQWKTTLLKLIGSIHTCLNQLFSTVDEEFEISDAPAPLPLISLSPDYIVSFPILLRRIQSLTECISIYLGSKSLGLVSVPISQLVDLLCRIYNVFDGTLMREFKDKKEFTTLMSCLPMLHYNANKLLSSILFSSGCHLTKYSDLFSRILIRLLNEYSSQRSIKMSIYSNISLCLQYFGYAFGEKICKPLVSSILKDIQLTTQKVTDVVSNQNKDKSKKRKRDGLTNSDALTTTTTITATSSYDIQIAALDTLNSLINCFGSSMDLYSRNLVDSNILSRILYASQTSLDLALEEDQLLKEKLYDCLLTSIMNPIEVQASILPHAIRIFSAGLNEQNHKLQLICKHGLAICDLIIHPRMPPTQTTTNTITKKLSQVTQNNVTNGANNIENDNDNKTDESETKVENNKLVTETKTVVVESHPSPKKELKTTEPSQADNHLEPINSTTITTSASVTHLEIKNTEKKITDPLESNLKKRRTETENDTTDILMNLDEKEKKSTQSFDFANNVSNEQEMDSHNITNNQSQSIKSKVSETIEFSDDDDIEFHIPDIDMTGPDTDDE
ncbi:unnamed protein product [Cunninghamella blakesleeana]